MNDALLKLAAANRARTMRKLNR